MNWQDYVTGCPNADCTRLTYPYAVSTGTSGDKVLTQCSASHKSEIVIRKDNE
jgi:hypothetical protein